MVAVAYAESFRGGPKVSSQSCDVTNQLYRECRRNDHHSVAGPGKILQSYTEKYAFSCFLEASFGILLLRDLLEE